MASSRIQAVRPLWMPAALLLGSLVAVGGEKAAQDAGESTESSIDAAALLSETCQSTVRIEGVHRRGRVTVRSHGAGVVVSEDGYIVTALHVVEGFPKVVVRTRDGQAILARTAHKNAQLDLALLKCWPRKPLTSAYFRPPAQAEDGDEILAIGNPSGRGHTAKVGLLGEPRTVQWCNTAATLRRVDAPIRPGFSGGGSFDLGTGELLGIQVAQSATNPDVGYIVPEEVVRDWIRQCRAEDREQTTLQRECLKRLGCWFRPVALQHPQYHGGLLITKFEDSSPMQGADVCVEDVLVAFDGFKVSSLADLQYAMGLAQPKQPVEFRVVRKSTVFGGRLTHWAGVAPESAVAINLSGDVADGNREFDLAEYLARRRESFPDIADTFEPIGMPNGAVIEPIGISIVENKERLAIHEPVDASR